VIRKRPKRLFEMQQALTLAGVSTHNLKNLTVKFPLEVLVCVTGVSGSGKSSLVTDTLVPAVRAALQLQSTQPDAHHLLSGIDEIDRIVEVDQRPLGRTGRSNPATYSGIWDEVRRIFAQTREARLRGYTARRFGFNSAKGRCVACKGQGTRRIAMHFMPDMYVTCPE